MIYLDRDAQLSLVEQMLSQLAGLIQNGQLPPGSRLPSIRKLASQTGVSTATVVAAYDRLTARGLIEARAASGYFVCHHRPLAGRMPLPIPQRSELDAVWLMQQLLQRHSHVTAVGSGFMPEHWLEDMLSSRFLAQFARKGKRAYAAPGAAEGYPPLRSQLSMKLGRAGIPAPPEQLLLTFGATQALDLICRSLLSPGDTVAVEEPAYFGLYAQLRALGMKLVGVPRLENGPDLAVLEEICSTWRPRLFFTQTLLHNPTGGSTDASTAFRLLELARRHQLLIVEDDVYGDLHPAPNPLRLAQADQLERVILVGSFSKVLSPAIRVGYIAATPELIQLFTEHKILSVLNSSELDERLVCELLTSGSFHKHLERLRARLSHHRAQAVQGLARAGLEPLQRFNGDLFIWARLPPGVELRVLVEDALENGFLLTPGDVFFLRHAPEPWLRFNAAAANDGRLFDYLEQRLGRLAARPQTLPSTLPAPLPATLPQKESAP